MVICGDDETMKICPCSNCGTISIRVTIGDHEYTICNMMCRVTVIDIFKGFVKEMKS